MLKVYCSSDSSLTSSTPEKFWLSRFIAAHTARYPSLAILSSQFRLSDYCTSFNPGQLLRQGLLISSMAVLLGCQHLASSKTDSTAPVESSQHEQETQQTQDTAASEPSFEAETLFDLIIAEMAGKQNRLDVTLGNYLKQAHRTKDPKIAARASRIAKYMNAHQATLDATKLWLEQEPDNVEALQMMTIQLIRAGQFEQALTYMEKLLAQDAPASFDFLVQHSQELSRRRRQTILTALEDTIKRYPNNPKLLFTKALLLHQNEDSQAAFTATNAALKADPQYISAIIFKAQLLHNQGKSQEASTLLRRAARKHPKHKHLGIVYARVLIEQGDLKAAHKQFKRLVDNFPDDYDLLLSLALISWENDLPDQAIGYLEQLVDLNHRQDEAYTYLAQIAQAQGNTKKTLELLQRVSLGPHFANAQVQIARLHAKNDNIEEAREVLKAARNLQPQQSIEYFINEAELLAEHRPEPEVLAVYSQALEKYPDNANILYSRAMFYINQDNLKAMEEDLRQILSKNPTNPLALNALGYTLADRTDRLEEALELIQKAIAIRADDPAVLDSLGWVYFKMGQIDTALQYLQRAYTQLKDHEIAAHLGEALWTKGNKTEAIRIWKDALEQNPESEIIRETMGRLRP